MSFGNDKLSIIDSLSAQEEVNTKEELPIPEKVAEQPFQKKRETKSLQKDNNIAEKWEQPVLDGMDKLFGTTYSSVRK